MSVDVVESSRVRLQDVAHGAGVSLATASKVMNGRANVRDETRARVAAVARNIGYRPKKREMGQRRHLVAVFRDLTSPYALAVMEGAARAAARANVDLVVESGGYLAKGAPSALSKDWMRDVAGRGAIGVVAVTWPVRTEHVQWSEEYSLPVIAVDPASTSSEDQLVTISATNWEGGSTAVQHLVDLGHRRIGVVAGPESSVPASQRVQGYRSVIAQAGIPFDPSLVRVGESYAYETGYVCAEELLGLQEPPTAIFAVADTLATGVLRSARVRGIRVPGQLSVVSFDDTPIATWSDPQLTAVHQPLFSMGQVAVERLIALATDPGLFAHPFKLETKLIERESTAPPSTESRGS